MRIIGRTPSGYIVELGEVEISRLATFSEGTTRAFAVGDAPDLHRAYSEVINFKRGIAALRDASAQCAKLADDLTEKPAKVTP